MTEWKRHKGGSGWRVLEDGRIVLENGLGDCSRGFRKYVVLDSGGAIRTKGRPVSMYLLWKRYSPLFMRSSMEFCVPATWTAAMVSIEAGRLGSSLEFDPISIRDEDGRDCEEYWSRPNRVSAGLMQTLLSTARAMRGAYPERFPQFEKRAIDLGDLCVPENSIRLGVAYMSDRMGKHGRDPALLVGSYNAGGVYETSKNPWNIRTFGRDRIPKFCAYHNDLLAVLKDAEA